VPGPVNENASNAVTVKNTELATVREAMRELSQLLERLDAGEIEKIVLTQKNQMRAVLLTVERYAELDARPVR
jgi:antitoxin (DNA-binding transcriptional repressor) of toxin-antitoxin stability system